jgi:hypothetical protein
MREPSARMARALRELVEQSPAGEDFLEGLLQLLQADAGLRAEFESDRVRPVLRREARSWLIQHGYRPRVEDWNQWERPQPDA